VENVNEVAQSAAAAAQQMSTATETLVDMAQELLKLTAQFRIQETATEEAKSLPAAVAEPAALLEEDAATRS